MKKVLFGVAVAGLLATGFVGCKNNASGSSGSTPSVPGGGSTGPGTGGAPVNAAAPEVKNNTVSVSNNATEVSVEFKEALKGAPAKTDVTVKEKAGGSALTVDSVAFDGTGNTKVKITLGGTDKFTTGKTYTVEFAANKLEAAGTGNTKNSSLISVTVNVN